MRCACDRVHGLRARARAGRIESQGDDASPCGGETRLPAHFDELASICFHVGDELDRLEAVGQHATTCPQDQAQAIQAGHEIACLLPEGHQNQIAECVALDIAGSSEAVLQDTGPQPFLRQGGECHPQIARWRDAEMGPQPTARPSVVAGADDGDGLDPQEPQRTQGHGQSVASPERHDRPGHSRPRSRWTTTDSMPWAESRAATSSARATLRCFPPVQPTAMVT